MVKFGKLGGKQYHSNDEELSIITDYDVEDNLQIKESNYNSIYNEKRYVHIYRYFKIRNISKIK